jgi:hypothetical protein
LILFYGAGWLSATASALLAPIRVRSSSRSPASRKQLLRRWLAPFERLPPQVVAVEFDEVKRPHEDTAIVASVSDALEQRDAYSNNTGVMGVLLVLGGNAYGAGCLTCAGAGNSIYWAVGPAYNMVLNEQQNIFTPLNTYTITVHVNGNTYQAFNDPDGVFDANSVLLSTFVNNLFSSGRPLECQCESGRVGLYDFDSALSFSNFSVEGTLVGSVSVPGPVAGAGFPGLFFAGISLLVWRRRRRSSGG